MLYSRRRRTARMPPTGRASRRRDKHPVKMAKTVRRQIRWGKRAVKTKPGNPASAANRASAANAHRRGHRGNPDSQVIKRGVSNSSMSCQMIFPAGSRH